MNALWNAFFTLLIREKKAIKSSENPSKKNLEGFSSQDPSKKKLEGFSKKIKKTSTDTIKWWFSIFFYWKNGKKSKKSGRS